MDQAREKMDCAVEEQKYIKHMISLRTSTEEIQKRLEQFWTEKLDADYLATKYCGNIFGPYGEREILESHIFKILYLCSLRMIISMVRRNMIVI